MRVQATVGGDGATASVSSLPDIAITPRFRVGRRTRSPSWDHRLRALGRVTLRIPPSSWMLFDIVILAVGVYSAYLAFPPPGRLATPHVALWQALPIFACSCIAASLVFGLYERETILSRTRIATRIALTSVAAAILTYTVIYVIMYMTVGRRVAALAFSIFVVGGGSIRLVAWWLAHKFQWGLLIVGPRSLYESFEKSQQQGILNKYRLVGYSSVENDLQPKAREAGYLGSVEQQIDQFEKLGITDIVVGDNAARDPLAMDWVVPCLQHGCRVTTEAIFHETATGQILVDQISPSWFLFADLKVHCDERATLKRAMDLTLAVLGLLLSAPLWLAMAIVIKLGDRGPVFYSQTRVGKHGEVFRLYKFRTMRTDAENGKSVWCAPNDPRITGVGRFLRKSRLDELPQLLNVLFGQMSLIGPRPERPDIVEDLFRKIPYYTERHLVKPGITGWAQISFRYGSTVEDSKRKLQFDLYYLKHMCFELDLIILFRTVGTFLKGAC